MSNDPIFEALNRAADECSPEDIDTIIAYIRKSKAAYERGEKVTKHESSENILEVLATTGAKVGPQATPGFKRRI